MRGVFLLTQAAGAFGGGLEPDQRPQWRRILGALAADAAVGKGVGHQAVVGRIRWQAVGLAAQRFNMGDGTLDHRPKLDEAVVVVDKLGLAHERGQRDACLLGMKGHLDNRAVVAHAAQQDVDALIGIVLQPQVLAGFEQEMTVDHPQAAIDGGADLENGCAADDLACLQDIAGAGHDHVHYRRIGHRERQVQLRQPIPKGPFFLQCPDGPAVVEMVVIAVIGRHHDRPAQRLARRQDSGLGTQRRGGTESVGMGLAQRLGVGNQHDGPRSRR